MCVNGTRLGATLAINQEDVVPARRRPEGSDVGPAVRITPYKTSEGQTARWKHQPQEVGDILEAYRAYLVRECGRRGRELKPTDPFFVSGYDLGRWNDTSARMSLSGDGSRIRALLPLDASNPYVGEMPHSMRYLAKQWVSSSEAKTWCKENGVDPDRREVIGEVLTDHSLAGMAALYRGDKSPARKELYSYYGTQITWAMLGTERGARHVPDGVAYKALLVQERAMREQMEALETELSQMCDEAERHGQELSPSSVLGRLARIASMSRESVDIGKSVVALETGRATLALSDHLPDDEVPRVDLARRKAEANGNVAGTLTRYRRIRNWLTPDEFAELLGRSASSVRGWVTTGNPGRSKAWSPSKPPIVAFNQRRRAILVEGLNDDLFDTFEKREGLARLLAQDPPPGWAGHRLMVGWPHNGRAART